MWERNNKVRRRRVLRGTAIGALGSFVGSAKASNGDTYSGVVYNPVTHKILGDVSVQHNDRNGRPVSIIRYGNKRIKVNNIAKISEQKIAEKSLNGGLHSIKKYQSVKRQKTDDEFGRVTQKIKIKEASDSSLSGYIDEEGQDRVAFAVSDSVPIEDIRNFVEITGTDTTEVKNHER